MLTDILKLAVIWTLYQLLDVNYTLTQLGYTTRNKSIDTDVHAYSQTNYMGNLQRLQPDKEYPLLYFNTEGTAYFHISSIQTAPGITLIIKAYDEQSQVKITTANPKYGVIPDVDAYLQSDNILKYPSVLGYNPGHTYNTKFTISYSSETN